MSKDTMLLPVKLTDQELLSKAGEAAEKTRKLSQAEASLKDVQENYKATIKSLKADVSRLLDEVENRREMRHVEVDTVPVPSLAKMEIFRQDTGELVATRAMSKDELDTHRQGTLIPVDSGRGRRRDKETAEPSAG